MQLPNQWLWDMVDEFVYQFQSFCQYRAKMKSKTEQEIALLRQYDQVILIGKHYENQDFPLLICMFSAAFLTLDYTGHPTGKNFMVRSFFFQINRLDQ